VATGRASPIIICYDAIYGSSACGILVRLGDLEGKSIWGRVGEFQCQIPAD